METNRIDWRQLGNRIADMRDKRHVTQAWLAERTGLSETHIGYLEQGKRHGTFDTYVQIVTELGFSLNDLISEDLEDDMVNDLAWELSQALSVCASDKRESIIRIVRDVVRMINIFHAG